jgi:hypothetical protein
MDFIGGENSRGQLAVIWAGVSWRCNQAVPCLSGLFSKRVDHSPFLDTKVTDSSQQTRIDLGGASTRAWQYCRGLAPKAFSVNA